MIKRIVELLDSEGPLTGRELCNKIPSDELTLWRVCNKSEEIVLKTFGKKFLRLDKRVNGYARLSPSIKREFLTYTVAGLRKDAEKVEAKSNSLYNMIKDISRQKLRLAEDIIKKIVEHQKEPETVTGCTCFIIAGDIVYEMAHSVPRPERSTGRLVRGSDIDIIAVTAGLSKKFVKELDSSIYHEKYYLLKNPTYMEEIDYIVKDISKIQTQLRFDSFKSMIASKILYEGKFLYGSRSIFEKIKKMLPERKIPEKLQVMKKKAITNRKNAELYLLNNTGELTEEEHLKLFYTKQEKEEIF